MVQEETKGTKRGRRTTEVGSGFPMLVDIGQGSVEGVEV